MKDTVLIFVLLPAHVVATFILVLTMFATVAFEVVVGTVTTVFFSERPSSPAPSTRDVSLLLGKDCQGSRDPHVAVEAPQQNYFFNVGLSFYVRHLSKLWCPV